MPDNNDNDDIKNKLNKFKPKKPKLTVPEEFLKGANSYDDKLMLVKYLTEREKGRVLLIFKKMIAAGMAESKSKKGLK